MDCPLSIVNSAPNIASLTLAEGAKPPRTRPTKGAHPLGKPPDRGFKSISKNVWKSLEREKGFEPSTLALARRCSTTELFPLKDGGERGRILLMDLPAVKQ